MVCGPLLESKFTASATTLAITATHRHPKATVTAAGPLARGQRLQRRAGRLVPRPPAGVAAGHEVGAAGGALAALGLGRGRRPRRACAGAPCASCGYCAAPTRLLSNRRPQLRRPRRPGRRRRAPRAPPRSARRRPRPPRPRCARSIPPMANQGTGGRRSAAWRTYSRPGGRAARAWSGVSHTGPTLSWSAPASIPASSCSGEWVDRPISTSSPTRSRTAATASSSWPTCTPSASAASARSGRSLIHSSAPWRSQAARHARGHRQQRVVVQRGVAQLEHVHAAGQRRLQRRRRPWRRR